MRLAVTIAPIKGRWHFVVNMQGGVNEMKLLVSDRAANGENFPGETVVRLPRRLTNTPHKIWQWYHGGPFRWPQLLEIGGAQ